MSVEISETIRGRGSCRAETTANGDWRMVFVWRAVLPHCRKILVLNNRTPHFAPRTEHCTLHLALKLWLTGRFALPNFNDRRPQGATLPKPSSSNTG
ncbi:hypothetical protein [Fervidibacter sacchari]